MDGKLTASRKNGKSQILFKRGDIVGESSLYHKSMIRSNLVVESEKLKCVGFGLTVLEDIFGDKIKVNK